ncbi:MAG: hypothetical protein ABL860_03530 [Candidatus Nitrotoga sp.]
MLGERWKIAPLVSGETGNLNPVKTRLESVHANPIQYMVDYYRKIDSYQVTIKSSQKDNSSQESRPSQGNTLCYYFKRPGHVRIEFIHPLGGAVIIYDPDSKTARLWPLGYPHFPAFTLNPENRLIQNSSGQRIDRSDFGALYQNVQTLQQHGKATLADSLSINGKNTLHLTVEGLNNFSIAGVHRFQLWVDQATAFPIKVSSHDVMGKILEVVEFEYLQINPTFPPDFFKQ